MITIYIKSLSGEIQIVEFSQEEPVTIYLLKLRFYKKGFVVYFIKQKDEDSKEESSDENVLSDDTILIDKDILYIFYDRQQFTKEELNKFENKIKKNMLFFPEFKKSIIKNKAIVAGGSVLSIFGDYSINDLDIYVNYSNAKELLDDLYVIGCSHMDVQKAPVYDESFFRKNNIIARFYTVMDAQSFYRSRPEYFGQLCFKNRISIDIMIIPDHIPLENVVTNFDLTFCQVWWDGEKLDSYDIDDVRSKSGSLNPDYVESFLNLNSFIIKRLDKYRNRGFKIKIDLSCVHENTITKKEKTFENERWAISNTITYISDSVRKRNFFNTQPQKLTLSCLYDLIDNKVVDAYIYRFYVEKSVHYPEEHREIYRQQFSDIISNGNEHESIRLIIDWNSKRHEDYVAQQKYLNEKREILRQNVMTERHDRLIMKSNVDNSDQNTHFLDS